MRRGKNKGIEEAIQREGSEKDLGKKLGVSQPAISYYLHHNCPALVAIKIEQITGVSRKKIRPDLFTQKGL